MGRPEFIETVVEAPPEGWTLGHVTLTLHSPEERIPVEAWRRGAWAVHERISRGEKFAVLTHAPTGLRINDFPTMDAAAECADTIEPFADWTSITKKFDTGSDLYPKVRAVVDSINDRIFDAVGGGQS